MGLSSPTTCIMSGSGTVTVNGTLSVTSGTMSHTGTWTCGATGNLKNLTAATKFAALVVAPAGGTTTANGNIYCGALTTSSGTFAQGTRVVYADSFTLGGATWTGSGAMNVAGALSYTSGTNSSTGITYQTASGNVIWNSYANRLADLRLAPSGGISTLTGTVYSVKGGTQGGTIVLGTQVWYMYPTASGFWSAVDGTVVTATTGWMNVMGPVGVNITLGTVAAGYWTFNVSPGQTITAAGNWTMTRLVAATRGVASGGKTDMASYNLVCPTVKVGYDQAANQQGVMDFGTGQHRITNISRGVSPDTGNVIDFGSSVIYLAGTLAGTGITGPILNAGGTVIGGTVNNLDMTGAATPLWHYWPAAAGTGNTLVTELSPPLASGRRRH